MAQNPVYFHNGDYVPNKVFTTFPCEYMRVYVHGLEENGVYLEDSRGYLIYEDGEVFLAKDNTDFRIYSLKDDVYIDSMNIQWKDDCPLVTEPYLEDREEVTTVVMVKDSPVSTAISTTKPITTTTSTSISVSTSSSSTNIELEEEIPVSMFYDDLTSNTEVPQTSEITHLDISNSHDTESGYMRFFDAFFPVLIICVLFVLVFMKGSE